MNSRQAAALQTKLSALLHEHHCENFIFTAMIEDGDDISALFYGRIQDEDSAKLSAVLVATLEENLVSLLARYNGLPAEAAVGALKGMLDMALDNARSTLHDIHEERIAKEEAHNN
jgi:hypothetical protein